ncbi:MAG: BON domain-containing protein [Pseudomonadales bacterium]|nr:BON domain-containing protein [Pseudomonadales bacterium]
MISLLRSFLLVTLLAALAACQTYDDPNRRTPGEVTDDTAILTTIKAKLIADPDIQGLSIDVDVYQGVVTLAGRIPSEVLRARALRIASTVKGVTRVHDSLALITE